MISSPELPITGKILLGLLATIAAAYDIRFRRIPNWLILTGVFVGLVWNGLASDGLGLGRSAAGLGLGFLLYFPLYLLRARGAGDVKLLAAAGAIVGPSNCFWLFMLTAILGGVIALIVVSLKGRVLHSFLNVQWIVRDLLHFKAPYQGSDELDVRTSKGMRLPHGAVIAVASVALLVMVQWHLSV